MIAKNEIEARMRWTHGSRQAMSVGKASPEFATYEMRNPKPGKGLGCFMA